MAKIPPRDIIAIGIPNHEITLLVSDEEPAARRAVSIRQVRHGSRSGRTARQFVDSLGTLEE